MGISNDHNIKVPGVYYLETQNPRMNPIAIRVGLTDPDYIFWEDTGNGRIVHAAKVIFDGEEVKEETRLPPGKIPNTIEFTSKDGEKFKLVKLTAELFNDKLKPFVAKGETLNFQSDDEVQAHYLKTDFYTAG